MKRTLNIIIFLFAALTMVAQSQTSFVVADKNGNSRLVQGLIFQQQNTDHFTWKADATNTGDIKDLLFIARTKEALSTASSEEVVQMLEGLSGTDLTDAEAVAAALQNNTNVEEAISEDGNNVVVKLKNSNNHIVYPLYEDADIFSDYDYLSQARITSFPKKARHQGDEYNGKVAIFNHFSGISGYRLQNRIVSNIKVLFELNGYDVAYYGTNPSYEYNGNIDYEQYFDHEHLNDVINHSGEYDAILIFSHGYIWNGKSYFATGEKLKTNPGEEWYCYEKEDGEYYFSYPVEGLKTNNRCIVYLGSCYGVPVGGYPENSFIKEKNSCFIGWNGKNRIAQADALVLFNNMLSEGLTLDLAMSCSFETDPWNASTERFEYNTANHSLKASSKPNYYVGRSLAIKSAEQFYRKEDKKDYWEIRVKAKGNWDYPTPIRLKIKSLLNDISDLPYEQFIGFLFSDAEQVTHVVIDTHIQEGIYTVTAFTLVNSEWKRLKTTPPFSMIYSNNLSDNYSAPVPPESEIRKPVVIDSNGQPITELSLPAGSSMTFEVDAYRGHELSTPCLDTDVCAVSLSGTTLTVTGISVGSTYFGVYDRQNKQMAVVKVTVTDGGEDGDTSCPDTNHPHWIDLGLPSGTKWACCNEGASKPEAYGGYYTFGQVSSAPTYEQIEELLSHTTSEWTIQNGVEGGLFTSSRNGSSIFLPAAGFRWAGQSYGEGVWGYYWSSTLSNEQSAYEIYFNSSLTFSSENGRDVEQTVRPVR